MPTRRGAAAAAVGGGKILVTGGANSLPGVSENGIHPQRPHNVLATVEEYDPATNSWRELAPMESGRARAVAAWTGRSFLVWGGDPGFTNGAAFTPAP